MPRTPALTATAAAPHAPSPPASHGPLGGAGLRARAARDQAPPPCPRQDRSEPGHWSCQLFPLTPDHQDIGQAFVIARPLPAYGLAKSLRRIERACGAVALQHPQIEHARIGLGLG